DSVARFDQFRNLRLHHQLESRIGPGLIRQEIEKIPLRHEAEKLTMRRQVREIGERDHLITNLAPDLSDFLIRPFEKFFDQTKFVNDLECRWMYCVAAKVAQKVRVLLQHHHFDAGAGKQKAEHHARRATTGEATGCGDLSMLSHDAETV